MSKSGNHAEDTDHELEKLGRSVGESFADAIGDADEAEATLFTTNISGDLDAALPPRAATLSQSILNRVAATPDAPAFGSPNADGTWRLRTWKEAGDEMARLAAGFLALGLKPEDRVAIASNTRVEWVLADGGVMLAGGANTTIYPSTGEDDFDYILNDSRSRFLVAEDQGQADKALTQLDKIPALEKIILIEGQGNGDNVLSWAEL